jgi:hypothetical protein
MQELPENKQKVLLEMGQKYLVGEVRSHEDLTFKDLSGLSNSTYVIRSKSPPQGVNPEDKFGAIIVRFFESIMSDFELEN